MYVFLKRLKKVKRPKRTPLPAANSPEIVTEAVASISTPLRQPSPEKDPLGSIEAVDQAADAYVDHREDNGRDRPKENNKIGVGGGLNQLVYLKRLKKVKKPKRSHLATNQEVVKPTIVIKQNQMVVPAKVSTYVSKPIVEPIQPAPQPSHPEPVPNRPIYIQETPKELVPRVAILTRLKKVKTKKARPPVGQ